MKPALCSVTVAAILSAGCAQQPPQQAFTVQKIDSSQRGDGTVRIRLTTPGDVAEADESTLVTYVKVVAVRQATQRQRQLADERARAAYRKMRISAHGSPLRARYLAVVTEKSTAPAASRAKSSVMIWDTQAQTIVGNNVYDVEETPQLGTVARIETFSAEYVGSGR